jgi:hypothetical protein
MSDGLVQLHLNLHVLDVQGLPTLGLFGATRRLAGSYSTVLTILQRHDWQKTQAAAGHLDMFAHIYFSACDVEHFYVVLRSYFDDFAGLCAQLALKPRQCPTSFHRLLRWCRNTNRATSLLGPELVSLVVSCTWFETVRRTRDGIVHLGALVLALPGPDTVRFQVRSGQHTSEVPPHLMTDTGLGDFEMFMAWMLGSLAIMSDGIGQMGLARLALPQPLVGTSGSPSMLIARNYLARFHALLPATIA